ncbi:hypothetical protein PG990_006739 [Apiospora arundinis]
MPSNATTSTTGVAEIFPDPTSGPTSEPLPHTREWSAGAKAGVGIGAFLGLICMLTGLFLWARWRARRDKTKGSAMAESRERYDKAELDSETREKTAMQQCILEAEDKPLSELAVQPVVPGSSTTPQHQPFELPGGGRES